VLSHQQHAQQKKSACPGRRRHVARVNNVATTCSTTCVSTCCASLLCRRVFVVAEEYVEVVTAAANRTCRTLTDDLRLLSDGSEPRCQIVNTLRDDLVAAMLHSDQVDIHKTVERSHNSQCVINYRPWCLVHFAQNMHQTSITDKNRKKIKLLYSSATVIRLGFLKNSQFFSQETVSLSCISSQFD